MARQTPQTLLRPLSETPLQSHLGRGLHTLGLLGWLLPQTGKADVYVTTFSTSEEFLSGFHHLRRKGLVRHATLVADLKASRKTVSLAAMMERAFDHVFLAENHSKLVLVRNADWRVWAVSSQNQTYGGRNECTVIGTSPDVFQQLDHALARMVGESVEMNGLFPRTTHEDRAAVAHADTCDGDCRPFGYEW